MSKWIDIKDELPSIGANVEIHYGDEGDFEEGQYTENRCCMLGPRAGAMGTGFISYASGNLPVDPTHWREI